MRGIESGRRGRPAGSCRTLTPEQEEQMQRLISDQRPEQLKLHFTLWTRAAVMLLIERECCQGRSKTRPVGRSKSRPVVGSQVVEYSARKAPHPVRLRAWDSTEDHAVVPCDPQLRVRCRGSAGKGPNGHSGLILRTAACLFPSRWIPQCGMTWLSISFHAIVTSSNAPSKTRSISRGPGMCKTAGSRWVSSARRLPYRQGTRSSWRDSDRLEVVRFCT